MLSTGIPELTREEDLNYLREAFVLNKTNEDATKWFTQLINESLKPRPFSSILLSTCKSSVESIGGDRQWRRESNLCNNIVYYCTIAKWRIIILLVFNRPSIGITTIWTLVCGSSFDLRTSSKTLDTTEGRRDSCLWEMMSSRLIELHRVDSYLIVVIIGYIRIRRR